MRRAYLTQGAFTVHRPSGNRRPIGSVGLPLYALDVGDYIAVKRIELVDRCNDELAEAIRRDPSLEFEVADDEVGGFVITRVG